MSEEGEITNAQKEFFEVVMSVFLYGEYKRFILEKYLAEAFDEWAKEAAVKKTISLIITI